jgi:TusA-related sulfurtransferase
MTAQRAPAARATFDHLVVAAATLADGIDWIATTTGVAPTPGGKHPLMGTHNALMRLAPGVFLEIIAIDPDAAKPARPRWYGLDQLALQSELQERPRLIHWVARTDAIDAACAACPVPLGSVHPVTRGDFRWRITIPDDGSMPGRGVVPTLIQWDVPFHPADRLPVVPVTLMQFATSHPAPETVRAAFAALGVDGAPHVTYDRETRLVAMLRTPRGTVTLSS